MNLDSIVKKISLETGKSSVMAEMMAQKLTLIHDLLKPVVRAWLRDERIGYEYEGITLDSIMTKENSAYIQAILTMDLLLKNPDFVSTYKKVEFDTDYIGG